MSLSWNGPQECPGCHATVVVGIMSLCATCPNDGLYFVDVEPYRGWYNSRAAYERGDKPIAEAAQ